MLRTNRVDAIKAECRKLMSGTLTVNVVSLICNENDGFTATAEKLRHLCIGRVRPRRCINDKQDHIGRGDGNPRLVLHRNVNHIAMCGLDPSCVNEPEALPVPICLCDEAIARGASSILNNCTAVADDSVKERALTYIRPTDERNQWESNAFLFKRR
jgi:hypothetical protein